MEASKLVVRTGKGIWPLIKIIAKVGILTLVFFFVIFTSIQESIAQGSIKPIVTEIGGRFFLITYNLYQDTNEISANYVDSGFKDKIEYLSSLFFDIYIVFVWLKLLKMIAQWLITGDTSRATTNWLIAIIIFFLLQYIFLLAGSLFDYIPNLEEGEMFKIPMKAFNNFIKVLPTIAEPFVNLGNKI